jgi:signal transduction histidine kinase
VITVPARVRDRWPLSPAVWLALDVVVAAVLTVALLRSFPVGADGSVGVGVSLALVMGAGVATRRLLPLPALVATALASAVSGYLGLAKDPMLALALVLYTVAVRANRTVAVAALGLAEIAVFAVSHSPAHSRMPPIGIISTATVQAAAWAIGIAVRTQRAYAAGLKEQAEQRVRAEVDRAQRALAEERLRIARELHDVVAHTMSIIAVQASVGAHVIDARPAEGRATLHTIERASRSALQELRAMLTVLRGRDAQPSEVPAPAPGLADLPALVERTRTAGLAIDVAPIGMPRPVPASVGLAGYRIVQEALTNVVRHAHAQRARVALAYHRNALDITVTDDGAGPGPSTVEGHGLIGMRERVILHSGRFAAGPCTPQGFRVHAVLPIDEGGGE